MRAVGRAIGLDVHRDFCEVAIVEGGALRSAGRIVTTPEALELFAQSLAPSGSGGVGGDRERVGDRADPRAARRPRRRGQSRRYRYSPGAGEDRQARRARAGAAVGGRRARRACGRRMSGRACCAGGWRGASSWCAPARARRTRSMPCSCVGWSGARRCLICSASRGARGCARSSCRSRRQRRSRRACATSSSWTQRSPRSSAQIAREALESPELRRLMTVPGVNVICAATFLAAVGEIRRFPTSRKLVGYLGLDPRVYQSGSSPAKGGRISKQGSPAARWALVEAAWSVVQQPGPLHAFYERIRARRGNKIAVVAVARKLAALFWSLLVARRGLRPRAALADGARSCACSRSAPAPRRARARRPGPGRPGSRCAPQSASSPSRPRPPTSERSATGKRQRRRRRRRPGPRKWARA